MNPLTVSIALSTALLCAAPAFLQAGSERLPRQAPPPEVAPIAKELQGAWRLVEFQTRTMPRPRRQEVGYLLVAGEFLSLECHIGWMNDAGQREASTFFSGTHSYELQSGGVILMKSLIGTTVDPRGSVPLFEQPGRRREYKIRFDGARLVLVRASDDQTFRFERLAPGQELDFYGRKKKPAPPEEPPPPRDGEKREE